MRFVALGRTKTLLAAAEACVSAGHRCVSIVMPGPRHLPLDGPASNATPEDFAGAALELECPLLCASDLTDPQVTAPLVAAAADVAISINWPTLIRSPTRAHFRHGVLNAHAGDLPRYRGNACPNWAILSGESAVVLAIHEMSDELDAGAILLKRRFDLGPDTYVTEVYGWFEAVLPAMFVSALDGLQNGSIDRAPQPRDPHLALRCYPRRPEDSAIVWSDSAENLARLVRASAAPFSGAYSFFGGQRVVLWRSRPAVGVTPILGIPGQVVVIDPREGTVTVLTGEALLVLEEVEFDDGWRGPPAVRINSTRGRFVDPTVGEFEALRLRLERLEAQVAGRRMP